MPLLLALFTAAVVAVSTPHSNIPQAPAHCVPPPDTPSFPTFTVPATPTKMVSAIFDLPGSPWEVPGFMQAPQSSGGLPVHRPEPTLAAEATALVAIPQPPASQFASASSLFLAVALLLAVAVVICHPEDVQAFGGVCKEILPTTARLWLSGVASFRVANSLRPPVNAWLPEWSPQSVAALTVNVSLLGLDCALEHLHCLPFFRTAGLAVFAVSPGFIMVHVLALVHREVVILQASEADRMAELIKKGDIIAQLEARVRSLHRFNSTLEDQVRTAEHASYAASHESSSQVKKLKSTIVRLEDEAQALRLSSSVLDSQVRLAEEAAHRALIAERETVTRLERSSSSLREAISDVQRRLDDSLAREQDIAAARDAEAGKAVKAHNISMRAAREIAQLQARAVEAAAANERQARSFAVEIQVKETTIVALERSLGELKVAHSEEQRRLTASLAREDNLRAVLDSERVEATDARAVCVQERYQHEAQVAEVKRYCQTLVQTMKASLVDTSRAANDALAQAGSEFDRVISRRNRLLLRVSEQGNALQAARDELGQSQATIDGIYVKLNARERDIGRLTTTLSEERDDHKAKLAEVHEELGTLRGKYETTLQDSVNHQTCTRKLEEKTEHLERQLEDLKRTVAEATQTVEKKDRLLKLVMHLFLEKRKRGSSRQDAESPMNSANGTQDRPPAPGPLSLDCLRAGDSSDLAMPPCADGAAPRPIRPSCSSSPAAASRHKKPQASAAPGRGRKRVTSKPEEQSVGPTKEVITVSTPSSVLCRIDPALSNIVDWSLPHGSPVSWGSSTSRRDPAIPTLSASLFTLDMAVPPPSVEAREEVPSPSACLWIACPSGRERQPSTRPLDVADLFSPHLNGQGLPASVPSLLSKPDVSPSAEWIQFKKHVEGRSKPSRLSARRIDEAPTLPSTPTKVRASARRPFGVLTNKGWLSVAQCLWFLGSRLRVGW